MSGKLREHVFAGPVEATNVEGSNRHLPPGAMARATANVTGRYRPTRRP
jgi:hypothetical protein